MSLSIWYIRIFMTLLIAIVSFSGQVNGDKHGPPPPDSIGVIKNIENEPPGTETPVTAKNEVVSGKAKVKGLNGKVTKGEGATLGPIEGTAGESGAEVTLSNGHKYKIAAKATFKKDASGKIWINGVLQEGEAPSKPSKSKRQQSPSQQNTQPVTFSNAQEASIESNGNYQIQSADQVNHGGLSVQNTQAMRFEDGTFTIERADKTDLMRFQLLIALLLIALSLQGLPTNTRLRMFRQVP